MIHSISKEAIMYNIANNFTLSLLVFGWVFSQNLLTLIRTTNEYSHNKLESHLMDEHSSTIHQLLGFTMLNNCGVLKTFFP